MSDKSVDACKRLATRTAELKYTRDEAGGSDPSWAAAGIPDTASRITMHVRRSGYF